MNDTSWTAALSAESLREIVATCDEPDTAAQAREELRRRAAGEAPPSPTRSLMLALGGQPGPHEDQRRHTPQTASTWRS